MSTCSRVAVWRIWCGKHGDIQALCTALSPGHWPNKLYNMNPRRFLLVRHLDCSRYQQPPLASSLEARSRYWDREDIKARRRIHGKDDRTHEFCRSSLESYLGILSVSKCLQIRHLLYFLLGLRVHYYRSGTFYYWDVFCTLHSSYQRGKARRRSHGKSSIRRLGIES